MSRREVAEAVNAFLWKTTGQRYELDAHYLAKIERGVVRWPTAPYRAGLRAVLGAGSDLELGFRRPRRAATAPVPYHRAPLWTDLAEAGWAAAGIAAEADELTGADLLNRREALTGAGVLTGSALTGPLQRWLEPLTEVQASAGSTFTPAEVEALERLVGVFRGWSRSSGGGLARGAVVGQLRELTGRLRGAPAGPLTARAFLAGAELAKIAGSMLFDAGLQHGAQRYYLTAVQMAKAAGVDSCAAVVLAALARQLYDLGEPGDGLELVALAQYGSRRSATPGLRALLHTREAWGYAQQGRTHAVHRAVGMAEEAHAERVAAAEPRWTRSLDDAELAGVIGARYRDLAWHDPSQAGRAVAYIGRALELRDASRPRNRVFDLIGMGRTHLITGEPEHGAALIEQALPLAGDWPAGRVGRKLGDFHRESRPWAGVPVVRRVREQLRPLVIT